MSNWRYGFGRIFGKGREPRQSGMPADVRRQIATGMWELAERSTGDMRLVARGHALHAEKRIEEALHELRTAASSDDPEARGAALFEIGRIEEELQRPKEALAAYHEAAATGAVCALQAMIAEAALMSRLGRIAEAETMFIAIHRSLGGASTQPGALFLFQVTMELSRLYVASGRRAEAVALIDGTAANAPMLADMLRKERDVASSEA